MSEQTEKKLTAEEELAAAQAKLAETEARLAAAEARLAENGLEADETPADDNKTSDRRLIEGVYDKLDGVPIKYIDIFIGLCAVAFVVVVVLGMLHGRGVF